MPTPRGAKNGRSGVSSRRILLLGGFAVGGMLYALAARGRTSTSRWHDALSEFAMRQNGENGSHHILVHGNAKGQGDLLRHSRHTPRSRIPLFLVDDGAAMAPTGGRLTIP